MEHQPDSEPAPAVFIGAADLEGLTGNTHSTADLGAPGTRKVDYATESRSKDERRCYGTHDTQLVSQQFDSGASGQNREAFGRASASASVRHVWESAVLFAG